MLVGKLAHKNSFGCPTRRRSRERAFPDSNQLETLEILPCLAFGLEDVRQLVNLGQDAA
jgi:hypothetical protein